MQLRKKTPVFYPPTMIDYFCFDTLCNRYLADSPLPLNVSEE